MVADIKLSKYFETSLALRKHRDANGKRSLDRYDRGTAVVDVPNSIRGEEHTRSNLEETKRRPLEVHARDDDSSPTHWALEVCVVFRGRTLEFAGRRSRRRGAVWQERQAHLAEHAQRLRQALVDVQVEVTDRKGREPFERAAPVSSLAEQAHQREICEARQVQRRVDRAAALDVIEAELLKLRSQKSVVQSCVFRRQLDRCRRQPERGRRAGCCS